MRFMAHLLESKTKNDSISKKVTERDYVTYFAEQPPVPQGGDDELQEYYNSNINNFETNFSSLDYHKENKYNIVLKQKIVASFAVSVFEFESFFWWVVPFVLYL
mgnify:CR=1 FL=1